MARRSGALDFLVVADSGRSAARSDEFPLAAEITSAQDKLDQLTHRVDGF